MSEENEFIDWQGGECPVDTDTLVQVLINGKDGTVTAEAGGFTWQRTNHPCDIIAYRVVEPPKPKVEIPEGFTPWAGGKRPVDGEVYVAAILRDGRRPAMLSALGARWRHSGDGDDIIAYRVVEAAKPKVKIPEGFTPWEGGPCPVPVYVRVEVMIRNGLRDAGCSAGVWHWHHSGDVGDIIAYRVVEAQKPEAQIPEGFTPWQGGERPVDPDTGVDVLLRGGTTSSCNAGNYSWRPHRDPAEDIIAYRVIEDYKPKTARDTQIGGDHCKKTTVQPWDVVDTWPIEQQIGWYRGNALKYVMLMGTKDENLREIRKATHYLQKLVEVLEQKGGVQ